MTAKTKAESVLLSATLIWGSTFAIVKTILTEVTPLQMIAFRFLVALALLLLFARRGLFPINGSSLGKGTILAVLLFVGFLLQTIGLQYTTASKSAFITGMMVVIVPFLQIFVERRAPKLGNIVGVGLVAWGLWLLTAPAGSEFNLGDMLTIVCALLFAFYIVYLDMIAADMTASQLTFIQFAVNGVLALGASLWLEPLPASLSGGTVTGLLYLTVFATLLTTYLQTRYQKDTTPTRAAIIFAVEPVFAAIIAFFALGEYLGSLGILGGALILGGVLISELSDGIPVLNRSLGPAKS